MHHFGRFLSCFTATPVKGLFQALIYHCMGHGVWDTMFVLTVVAQMHDILKTVFVQLVFNGKQFSLKKVLRQIDYLDTNADVARATG